MPWSTCSLPLKITGKPVWIWCLLFGFLGPSIQGIAISAALLVGNDSHAIDSMSKHANKRGTTWITDGEQSIFSVSTWAILLILNRCSADEGSIMLHQMHMCFYNDRGMLNLSVSTNLAVFNVIKVKHTLYEGNGGGTQCRAKKDELYGLILKFWLYLFKVLSQMCNPKIYFNAHIFAPSFNMTLLYYYICCLLDYSLHTVHHTRLSPPNFSCRHLIRHGKRIWYN